MSERERGGECLRDKFRSVGDIIFIAKRKGEEERGVRCVKWWGRTEKAMVSIWLLVLGRFVKFPFAPSFLGFVKPHQTTGPQLRAYLTTSKVPSI